MTYTAPLYMLHIEGGLVEWGLTGAECNGGEPDLDLEELPQRRQRRAVCSPPHHHHQDRQTAALWVRAKDPLAGCA